jgi:transcriptional regulator with XRE-family HTH domain
MTPLYYMYVVYCQDSPTSVSNNSGDNLEVNDTVMEGATMRQSVKNRQPFAERLVELRKAKGISQKDLADITGISPRMIAHYETFIKNPSAGIVLRLAKAFGVSIDQLMGKKPVVIKQSLNRNTVRQAKMLDELPTKDRKAVIQMIETLHGKKGISAK